MSDVIAGNVLSLLCLATKLIKHTSPKQGMYEGRGVECGGVVWARPQYSQPQFGIL